MTIQSATSKIAYAGAGTTGPFTIPWLFYANTDITVYTTVVSTGVITTLVNAVDYNLTGAGVPAGGTCTTTSSVAVGTTITLALTPPLTQLSDYVSGETFPSATLEQDLDREVQLAQYLQNQISLAVRAPSSEVSPTMTLPAVATRASQYLAFDASGNVTIASGVGTDSALRTDLANTTTAGKGNELISYRRTAAETAAGVTPVNYYELPGMADRFGTNTTPGTTDMTTALVNWAKCATPGLDMQLKPGGIYLFDPSAVVNGILFSGKANFNVRLNGATIIAKNGASVVAQHEMMRFNNCQDVNVYSGTIDANRAGRTPVESTSHNINVADYCKRINFYGVRAINATTDGFYVGCDAGSTLAAYPEDIYFDEACQASNAYRNNMSVVASLRCKVRGRYSGATGTSPQAGVDFEPDVTHIYGNKDLDIDIDCSDNVGYGAAFAGPGSGAENINVRAKIRGRNNTAGLLQVANITGGDVSVDCGPHTAATRGVVDISNGTVSDLEFSKLIFRGVTINSAARWLLYNFGTTGRLKISNFRAYGCPNLPAYSGATASDIDGVSIESTPDASFLLGGATSTLRNFTCKTATGRVIYVTGTDVEMDGITLIDCLVASSNALTVAAGATGSILRNARVLQTTSIPASAVGISYAEIPLVVQNVVCRSAGTDFTSANAIDFTAGTSGSFIDGCKPGGQNFLSCSISPAQIVANTNDYAPTGLKGAAIVRLYTDAARNITGLTGGVADRQVLLFNIGGFNAVLTDNDAASTAANRFLLGANITMAPNTGVSLWYDGASSRWRANGRSV